MTSPHAPDTLRFPVLPKRAKAMRLALVPPVFFLALVAVVIALAYDFEPAVSGNAIDITISLGPIAGVVLVVGGLAWNTWRKIPRRFDGAGLVLAPDGISIDYGNGAKQIDLTGVTGIQDVAPRPGMLPEAIVLCKTPDGDLTRRQRNWVLYRVSKHIAKVHQYRQQDVLPLALLGEAHAPEITAALRARLDA